MNLRCIVQDFLSKRHVVFTIQWRKQPLVVDYRQSPNVCALLFLNIDVGVLLRLERFCISWRSGNTFYIYDENRGSVVNAQILAKRFTFSGFFYICIHIYNVAKTQNGERLLHRNNQIRPGFSQKIVNEFVSNSFRIDSFFQICYFLRSLILND